MLDNEIIKLFKSNELENSLIVVLFEGNNFPEYCEPMPIEPNPDINIPINDFMKIYLDAIKTNPAIHDGAVMVQIDEEPIIRGWCYRLYPPSFYTLKRKNKGSGYNSSLQYSGVDRVNVVYFTNKIEAVKFIKGNEIPLADNQYLYK